VIETGLGIMLSFVRSVGVFVFGLHEVGMITITAIHNAGIVKFFIFFILLIL
jgi:hypothetical protein